MFEICGDSLEFSDSGERDLLGEQGDQFRHTGDDLVGRPATGETAQLEPDQCRDCQRCHRFSLGYTERAKDRDGEAIVNVEEFSGRGMQGRVSRPLNEEFEPP